MHLKYIIEIATTDFVTTRSAVEGGADRIELCASLVEGGITPSLGTITKCRETFDVQLFPIIRPRGGDFLYTEEEFQVMLSDVLLCKKVGCDGVVVGFLKNDGTIDLQRTAQIVYKAYPMEVTFHRAFDRCKNPFEALEQLIEIGCQRILTSGQKPAAPEGVSMISQLVNAAEEKIIIMPGSGIRKENIKEIAEQTGAVEFHSSLRGKSKSKMEFIHPSFNATDYDTPGINPEEVEELRKALQK